MLTSLMPLGLAVFVECVVVGRCLLLMYAVIAVVMIFMERKVCAAFQCRLGPVRVGFWGLLQVPADVLKMLTNKVLIWLVFKLILRFQNRNVCLG